jgi:hypothetical protein
MRDVMQDDTSARVSIVPLLRSANAAVNGTGVDLTGTGNFFRSAMLLVIAGAITDGTHTFKLQESDDNSSFSDVAAGDLSGSLTAVTTANASSVQRQSYTGSKRYLRAVVTTAGATTGGNTAAVIIMGSGSGAAVT